MRTVKIKDTEYKVLVHARAMFYFETITGKSFNISNITEDWLYMYCILMAANEDMKLTFNEFCDYIDDEDPSIITVIREELDAYSERMRTLAVEDNNKKSKKKS